MGQQTRRSITRSSMSPSSDDIPVPQAWLVLDVDNMEKAMAELESQGHWMIIKNKVKGCDSLVGKQPHPEGVRLRMP